MSVSGINQQTKEFKLAILIPWILFFRLLLKTIVMRHLPLHLPTFVPFLSEKES